MSYPNVQLLIVDTEASVQKIKLILIEELGFIGENIYSTDSFKEAFEILESNQIDLILSELEVSGASGLFFLKELKEHDKYGNLPVIVSFSLEGNETIRQDISKKVSYYLEKPLSAKKINSKLQQILKSERRVHERCEVVKENVVTIVNKNKPATSGKIVNIGKGGLLAQLEVSRELIIYDKPSINISFYGSPSKELFKTLNAELLRIERVSKDKTKKTAYYAFAFSKLDKKAQKLLVQLINL